MSNQPADLVAHRTYNRYLKINLDYLEMLDWDHCSAAILAWFEYAWNSEIDKAERENADLSDVWIKAPMTHIVERTLRMYGVKSICKSIQTLTSHGILIEDAGDYPGVVKRYQLNVGKVNRLLSSGGTLKACAKMPVLEDSEEPPEEHAQNFPMPKTGAPCAVASVGASVATTVDNAHARGDLNLKEVEERTENKEKNLSSPLPPSGVDEDGYEAPRAAPAQRSKWQRPGQRVKRKSLSARLRDGELDGDPADAAAIPGRTNPRSAAAACPAAPETETTRLPDIALRWNAAVKSGPVVCVWSPGRFEAEALRKAQANPQFVGMLDELLAKCEKLNSNGHEFALGKLIQDWAGVANGTYDWMLKGQAAKPLMKSFAQRASDDLFASTLRRIDEMAERGEIKKS